MKKLVIFPLIAVMLLAAGCNKTDVTPTTPETTVLVTEPTPECTSATVQVADAPAILMLLNRGDTVDVVKEYDEGHYMVKVDDLYGLVEKQLLRLSGESGLRTKSTAPAAKASNTLRFREETRMAGMGWVGM